MKRAIDIVSACVGLIVLAPLLGWCAYRIAKESPGAPLFRQLRVGRDGKQFRIHKFRTMQETTEEYAVAPHDPSDSRITPFGRWLRATSLDELPQLIDVLTGHMSLVGPRPEMPFIVESYDDWQRRRLSVKPGITGLWQILGRKDLPMHENLQYDFYYIRNRSLGQDLSILLRTVGAVLSRRGAF
jgi:lipopolysaccharide/colanic/teichoic acid biosynthesis glycosyltransferase